MNNEAAVGTVVALWRYAVKSMAGEELNGADLTERGLLGDRGYALVDQETGKVASAKNPRKWPALFDFRAAFAEPPRNHDKLPAVWITFPDGTRVHSEQADVDRLLSAALGRRVTLARTAAPAGRLEEYWPDIEGLAHREIVTDEAMPPGTFFDCAVVHLLTTSTLDRLRAVYPAGRFEVRRFRPNVVVKADGQPGFVENDWVGRTLVVGDEARLEVTGPCPRCVMTTLPQGDLPADRGILRAAAQHNDAHVGVYAAVARGGSVRRGDRVHLA